MPKVKRKFPPGVRFHPTDVELVLYYLLRMVLGNPLEAGFVAEVDIYKFHPAALKALAYFSEELNWYFFCSAGNKYKTGGRKSRTTPCGYWKPTGNDKVVSNGSTIVGYIKTLVFQEGNTAKGERTDWVMHEYRLEASLLKDARCKAGQLEDDESAEVVLCKIFKKGGLGPRNGEQFGAPYNETECEPVAENAQISSAELNENDTVSADPYTLTATEHVSSGAVLQSEICLPPTPTSNAANFASTSHGVTLNANPFQKNPIAGSDIPSSSMGPIPDHNEEMFCLADFEVNVSGNPIAPPNTAPGYSGPVGDPFDYMWCRDDVGYVVVSADANNFTNEQVWPGASAASTSNGFAFATPIAPPDIVPGSTGPMVDETWFTDDVGDIFHNNNILDDYFTMEDFCRQLKP